MSNPLQFVANGLASGAGIGLIALGFSIIYFSTRTFHVALGATYVSSAFALVACTTSGIPVLVAAVIALLVGIATGVFIDHVVYRPLVRANAPDAVLLISSLGVLIVFENAIAGYFGNENVLVGKSSLAAYAALGVRLGFWQIVELGAALITVAALWVFFRYTGRGRLLRAMGDDPDLCRIIGIPTGHVRDVAFILGSALAALGSVLSTLDVGIDPHVGFAAVLSAVVACILGGKGRLLAPAIGALSLGILQGIVDWRIGDQWRATTTFGVLLSALLFLPHGLATIRKSHS